MPTAEEFAIMLRRHVIDVWFPRCLDSVYGGLLCDFDRQWKPCGSHHKLLEFQARQTWLAAELLQFAPDHHCLQQVARQGFYYLRDVIWDQQSGGWFHCLQRRGEPLEEYTKHLHGMAYGISACAAVHKVIKEPGALELSLKAFEWIEEFAYDREHGGYLSFFKKDGTVISKVSENPLQAPIDTLGLPLGMKDANVHSDLLVALIKLYEVCSEAKVRIKLNEIVQIMAHRMSLTSGEFFYLCKRDWVPVPHIMRYGLALQTASGLLESQNILGLDTGITKIAQALVDCCLRYGWDRQVGGFFYASPASLPMAIEDHDLIVRRKVWWVQFEALKALLFLSNVVENNKIYLHYFDSQWDYIKHFIFDSKYGGVYPLGLDMLPPWQRKLQAWLAPGQFTYKGNTWKDCSHEGRVLLYCLEALKNDPIKLKVYQ